MMFTVKRQASLSLYRCQRMLQSTASGTKPFFFELFNRTFPLAELTKRLDSPPDTDDDPSYIINDPVAKLSVDHPYITTCLADNEDVINRALLEKPDRRAKPLIVITKGKGGGKTRIIEELKQTINSKHDSLAVAVTFNNHTEFDNRIDILLKTDPLLTFTLSIITRTISSIYKSDLSYSSSLLRDEQGELKVDWRRAITTTRHHHDLLREFFAWIIENHPKKKDVKNLVIFVDEYRQFVDGYLEEFPTTSPNTAFSSPLQKALLNKPLRAGTNSCLVISTLIFSPSIVVTDSRRVIYHLRLADELNTEDVLNEWIFNPKHPWLEAWIQKHNLSPVAITQFKLLIALFNRLPRCIEFLEDCIKDDYRLLRFPIDERIEVNSDYFQRLLQYVFDRFQAMYYNTFPDSSLMMKILQEEPVNYRDPMIPLHLKDSTLVNTLNPVASSGMVPVASIFPLYSAAKSTKTPDVLPSQFIDLVEEVQRRVMNYKKAGDLLEYLGSQWILFKFMAMKEAQRSLSLLDFFRIPRSNKEISESLLEQLEETVITIPRRTKITAIRHDTLEQSSWNGIGKASFLTVFNQIQIVDSKHPVQLHYFHEGEAFDICLVVYDEISRKPLIFFIDYKSTDELIPLEKGKGGNQLPKSGKQYYHLRDNVIPNFRQDKDLSPTLLSLIHGDYFYIYLTTKYEGLESFSEDRAIVLTRQDSQRFFSFMFPLYRALRGLVN